MKWWFCLLVLWLNVWISYGQNDPTTNQINHLRDYVYHFDGETNQNSHYISEPFDESVNVYSVSIPIDKNGVYKCQNCYDGETWHTFKEIHISFNLNNVGEPLCCTNSTQWHLNYNHNPPIEFQSPLNWMANDLVRTNMTLPYTNYLSMWNYGNPTNKYLWNGNLIVATSNYKGYQEEYTNGWTIWRELLWDNVPSFRVISTNQTDAWSRIISVSCINTNIGTTKNPQWGKLIDIQVYWPFEFPTNWNTGYWPTDRHLYCYLDGSHDLKKWSKNNNIPIYFLTKDSLTNRIGHFMFDPITGFNFNSSFFKIGRGIYDR